MGNPEGAQSVLRTSFTSLGSGNYAARPNDLALIALQKGRGFRRRTATGVATHALETPTFPHPATVSDGDSIANGDPVHD